MPVNFAGLSAGPMLSEDAAADIARSFRQLIAIIAQHTQSTVDMSGFPGDLKALGSQEIEQLKNINLTTISAAQWAYLGALNQSLVTTASVEWANVTLTSGGILYFGDSATNGSWRLVITSNEFRIERRESGSWVKYFGAAP